MNWTPIAAMAALVLAAGSANATTITFDSFGVGASPTTLPAGEKLVTNFGTNLGDPVVTAAGYTLSGTGQFLIGNSSAGAAPAFSTTTADPTQFLSVEGGESETLTTPPTTEISFYIGSLDAYNTITFGGPGGGTYTGAQLGVISGANDGNQTAADTNGRFTFDFSAPIDSVTLTSSQNSFEFSDIAAVAGGVPEPATWTLMLVGFGALGGAMRSRRKAGSAAIA